METFEKDNVSPASAFAEYSTLKINDETDKFRFSVSGYNGDYADSLAFHYSWRFSTFDNDNDGEGSEKCAADHNGACWQEGSLKTKRIHKQPEPIDCMELYQQGYSEDGIYVIKPTGITATDVWCDMTNGAWTVIQRRQDGSEDFYRNWEDYKNGFENRVGEYWLGLENIHHLTKSNSSLHVYMETFKNDNKNPFSAFAEYTTFMVNDESDKYRLTVGGYHGSCGDSMWYHNNWQFTTKDSDNDDWDTGNCAQYYGGAWWYKSCHNVNLNGLYLNGANTEYGRGINWGGCWGLTYSLKNVVMKIRRDM
ncbi:microfibril-associated glycoprotein 4-like [Ruditapes philippinarum]|uniref:microfibril-associated glycoprotein 4-like n=1 Tax=Ruditapes philippinarum TaxID=129788 RepID=UPI00295A8541|nr:microfibril-associated glycoprotein 4-like [Ruditapes philippinarum]